MQYVVKSKLNKAKNWNLPTQLSHRLQWDARGGRNILHVKQYLSLTDWPRTKISFVLGGGRYVGEFALFGTSDREKPKVSIQIHMYNNII
jgi:hypothetical protein